MDRYLDVRVEVAAALATGRPVVALESTVFVHGLPRPINLETAAAMEEAVRAQGAVPATIGLLSGRAVIGLTGDEIAELAADPDTAKVSVRDISAVIAGRRPGATTVAATAALAARTSIRVMATGGIGGVHRNGETTLDVSADLYELARSPVAVVCAGAKAVLDLPRTVEVLESLGIPILGFGTSEFPAFYARESGIPLEHRVDDPADVAAMLEVQSVLGRGQGVVVTQAPPAEASIPRPELDGWIEAALAEAAELEIVGKDATPYLLKRVGELSSGRTVETNVALLVSNASLAARIAQAVSIA